MADYHPLILRAVEGLEKNTGENRRALYERARIALVAQLRGVQPALDESEITRERLALDEAVARKKPFYVNLWPDDVHSPYFPPLEKWTPGKHRLYLSVLEEMDRQLGRILERLRADPALRDNTILLICSDNGPEPGRSEEHTSELQSH